MKAVVYARVSTDEQNPRSQLEEVLRYAEDRGYEVVRVFEENVSGSVDPFQRPEFTKLLEFLKSQNVDVVVMYDLTRFYRAASPTDALNKLRRVIDEYQVLVDFAREPEIEDPLFRELWMFIKSWFATYERLQASIRTRYGLARLRKEGKLYHKPDITYYYAAWLYNKDLSEVSQEEYVSAKKQLQSIVKRYWENSAIKKTRIAEVLARNELREMYQRFPRAPRSYLAFYRLIRG